MAGKVESKKLEKYENENYYFLVIGNCACAVTQDGRHWR